LWRNIVTGIHIKNFYSTDLHNRAIWIWFNQTWCIW
jgi:hypothetical protein